MLLYLWFTLAIVLVWCGVVWPPLGRARATSPLYRGREGGVVQSSSTHLAPGLPLLRSHQIRSLNIPPLSIFLSFCPHYICQDRSPSWLCYLTEVEKKEGFQLCVPIEGETIEMTGGVEGVIQSEMAGNTITYFLTHPRKSQ